MIKPIKSNNCNNSISLNRIVLNRIKIKIQTDENLFYLYQINLIITLFSSIIYYENILLNLLKAITGTIRFRWTGLDWSIQGRGLQSLPGNRWEGSTRQTAGIKGLLWPSSPVRSMCPSWPMVDSVTAVRSTVVTLPSAEVLVSVVMPSDDTFIWDEGTNWR